MFTIDKRKVLLLLAEKQMNVTDLGKASGHSRQHWHQLFTNKTRKVGPKVLGELAKALGVKPVDIIVTEPTVGG